MLLHTALGGGGGAAYRGPASPTAFPDDLKLPTMSPGISCERNTGCRQIRPPLPPPPRNSQGIGRGCHGKGHYPSTRGLQLAKDDDVDWCRVPQRQMQRDSLQTDRLVERHCDSPGCRDVGGVSKSPYVEMTIYPGGPCRVSERIRRAGQGTKLFTELTNLVGVGQGQD